MKPKEIRKHLVALQILWDDGQLSQIDFAELRSRCSCAVCRELKNLPDFRDPRFERARNIQALDSLGNYALGVTWGDSHKSIFAFDRLRG